MPEGHTFIGIAFKAPVQEVEKLSLQYRLQWVLQGKLCLHLPFFLQGLPKLKHKAVHLRQNAAIDAETEGQ